MRDAIKKNSDAMVGIIFLAVCGVLVWKTLQIKTPESRLVPFFVLGMISVCSLWLIFRTVILHRSPAVSLFHNKRELIVWGMFGVLLLLISFLGFYVSAFIFMFGCNLYLSGAVTKKTILRALIYAIAIDAAMFLCFTLAVRMSLPRGLLI